jgi:hypothetical protein
MDRIKKISDYYHNDDEYKIKLSSSDMLSMIQSINFLVYKDDKKDLRLYDKTNGNRLYLGNIERESFSNLYDIIERLHDEIYIHFLPNYLLSHHDNLEE